jgi:hypothetical protein
LLKKQKIGFESLRMAAAFRATVGQMDAVYYEGICYKEGIGTKAMNELLSVLKRP